MSWEEDKEVWKLHRRNKHTKIPPYISFNKKKIIFSIGFIEKAILKKCSYVKLFFNEDENKIGFLFSIQSLKDSYKIYTKYKSSRYTSPENFMRTHKLGEYKGIRFTPDEETIQGLEGYSISLSNQIKKEENITKEIDKDKLIKQEASLRKAVVTQPLTEFETECLINKRIETHEKINKIELKEKE